MPCRCRPTIPALLLLATLPGEARAATLSVGTTGGYSSIQDAIDDASSGDTITVAAGTYAEALDLGTKELTLTGAGASLVTLKPPSGSPALTIDGGQSATTVSGFTITPSSARALYLDAVDITASDLDISGATGATQGGAVYISGGSLSLSSSTFADDGATYGADLFITAAAQVTLESVDLSGGVASWGGAIYAEDASSLDLTDVTFADSAAAYAGAVYAEDCALTMTRVDGSRTSSTYYGGFAALVSSTLAAEDLSIVDPSGSRTYGGGIYADEADITWSGGGVSGARIAYASSGYTGGGLYLSGDSTLTASGLLFEDNEAHSGAGIALIEASAELSAVEFDANSAYRAGGGLYLATSSEVDCSACVFVDNEAKRGGAADVTSSSRLVDDAGEYTDNVATDEDGGALRVTDEGRLTMSSCVLSGNLADQSGGAIYLEDPGAAVSLESCELEANETTSGDGGAIAALDGAELSLGEVLFADNVAGGAGGAVAFSPGAARHALTIEGGSFDDNDAREGGALYVTVGALSLSDASLEGNTASRDGGGVLIEAASEVLLRRVLLHENVAGDEGGAVLATDLAAGVDLTVGNCVFSENEASDGAGLMLLDNDAVAGVVNNTFVANDASGDGGHLVVDGATVEFVNNIAWQAVDGGGLYAADAGSASGSDVYYCDVYNNSGGDYTGSFTSGTGSSGNISADPYVRAFSADGVEDNDDLRLTLSSPCLDAGDPSIVDVDGSSSDIGAYGGPDADASDDDGDGYYDITDCDDADASVHPGASEAAYDGVDQDCDGADLTDVDKDGYDAAIVGGLDCDDTDDEVSPDAEEIWYDGFDQDCDGLSDFDADGDGYDTALYGGTDCDDDARGVNPGAAEIWYDGFDQNCDGLSDYDADQDGQDSATWGGLDCNDLDEATFTGAPEVPYDTVDQDCDGADLIDVDGDGVVAVEAGGTDCVDDDPTAYPGAQDSWYDGVDSDCDGADDFDADLDGYGSALYTEEGDCDDADPSRNPGMVEIWYDGVDRDCDGRSDFDADRDGHDAADYGGDDCEDADAAVSPSAAEVWYDGFDQDCDGLSDFDADGDGFDALEEGGGLDCDDSEPQTFPGADERYDGEDNDCDGFTELDDRDSDGLIDWFEWELGSDPADPDTDDDGMLDGEEAPPKDAGVDARDTDADGIFDVLDEDDDGDGIPSARELTEDADGDGEADPDVDGDGTINALDRDADGDGYPDADEGVADIDEDGVPDYVDYTGDYTGGGCASAAARPAGGRLAVVVLSLLGACVPRRRRRGC